MAHGGQTGTTEMQLKRYLRFQIASAGSQRRKCCNDWAFIEGICGGTQHASFRVLLGRGVDGRPAVSRKHHLGSSEPNGRRLRKSCVVGFVGHVRSHGEIRQNVTHGEPLNQAAGGRTACPSRYKAGWEAFSEHSRFAKGREPECHLCLGISQRRCCPTTNRGSVAPSRMR